MKPNTNAMTAEDIRAATAEISALRERMKFPAPLPTTEPRGRWKGALGLKKLRSVQNRVAAAREHRQLLPPAFDLRAFERDAALTGAWSECLAEVQAMLESVSEALREAGTQASTAGETAFAHIKVALRAQGGVKRSAEKTGSRGARSSPKGTEPSEVPKPAEPAPTAAGAVDPSTEPSDKAA